MSEIVRCYRPIEDTDLENQLFESFITAREALLKEIKDLSNGLGGNVSITELYNAERNAFSAYSEYRLRTNIL